MKKILLTIEYDGTNFSGWQVQPRLRTVQGEIEKVLSNIAGKSIKVNGTSRTDSGVHAYGQRASFSWDCGIPIEKIPIAVTQLLQKNSGGGLALGGDIRILEAREVSKEFHARFDARSKRYIYRMLENNQGCAFKRNYYYEISQKLDIQAMSKAALEFVGTHDFQAFQALGGYQRTTTVRTISSLEVKKNDQGEIEIEIIGDGFLYNMVRIIAGTLLDVGIGKKRSEDMIKIIEGKDRSKAGHTAPPQGLYLAEIYYDMIK